MWACLSNGMVSIVCDSNDPTGNSLIVRSRGRKHLVDLFPEMTPIETMSSDYRYRIFVSKDALKERMCSYVDDMKYTNFKDSVEDPILADFYGVIWQRGFVHQHYGDFDL